MVRIAAIRKEPPGRSSRPVGPLFALSAAGNTCIGAEIQMTNRLTSPGRAILTALLLPLLAWGCGRGDGDRKEAAPPSVNTTWNPQSVTEVRGVPVAQLRAAIQQRTGGERPEPLDSTQWRHVRSLYTRYGGGPLWFDQDGLARDRSAALLDAVIHAPDDALALDGYPLEALRRALVAVTEAKTATAEHIADADVLLTSTYAALGEDLLTGQIDPRSVSQSWHIDPQEEHVDSALLQAIRAEPLDRSIATMRPADPDYASLSGELQRYRKLAAAGGWPKVPAGAKLAPGDRAPAARLAALRRRLQAEGLLASDSAAAAGVYDPALAGGVAAFQARHGIVSDSVLGDETVASLNVPVTYRAGQIAANMERFRWLPRTLGSRYILVNVPAFRLEAFDGGKKVLEMKVIVGAEYQDRATPVFSDSMEYVVFRPYWLVTDSIAAREVFPKAEADPGYLAEHNYELYQQDGKTRVRQKPGPENSLGLVKFIFPNDFAIYLHDTPEDDLFNKDVRAFSHGCIRVEKPEELANYVLGWPIPRIRQAMQRGKDDDRVSLPHRLPVYIAYFTAYFRDGKPYFGSDLYQRDDELIHAVANGALPSAQTLKALQALRSFVAD
jgi:murein L,D-transpeptidase YcbB/YkuD